MKTILLITYDISPYRGSEASVSWNYVNNMKRYHKLIVLYGRGQDEIDNYLKTNRMENVSFVNVPVLNIEGHGLLFDIKYNWNYRRWHKKTYSIAQKYAGGGKIDIIHYLNPIGFKEPGFCWKIAGIPYCWGPIQGVENRPIALFKALSLKGKINAIVRRIVHNGLLILMPRVRKALRRADVVFSATPNTVKQLKRYHHKDSIYLPENGIIKMERREPINVTGELRLIWVGEVNERKALGILLDALGLVKYKGWHLDVVGKGSMVSKLKNKAIRNGISDHIIWHGALKREQVQDVFRNAHLHIITSLGEGNPTVLWEAMSWAIPTMTLDHCGMSGVVCDNCGIKIQIRSYQQVINDIALKIEQIIDTPERLTSLSKGVIECADKFMWNNRIEIYNEVYSSYE